ncbi:hypothetical protein ACFLYT_00650 [Nanoarchaeota archaeon]
MDGLICGGSVVGTGATIGKYAGVAALGVGAVPGVAADAATTIYKRIMKTAKVIFKSESYRFIKYLDNIKLFKFDNLKVFFKLDNWHDVSGLRKGWKAMRLTMNNHQMALRIINKQIGPEDLAKVIKTAEGLGKTARGLELLMRLGTVVKQVPYNDADKVLFLRRLGDAADKMQMPPNALREVAFEDLGGQTAGLFEFLLRKATFPPDRVPELITIAHELGHGKTAQQLVDKIKNLDGPLANVISEGSSEVGHLRGFMELIADRAVSKGIKNAPLSQFLKEFKESYALDTVTGVTSFINDNILYKGSRFSKLDGVHYLTYMHALAKKTKDTAVVNAIEKVIKTDTRFSTAATNILDLANDLNKNIDLVDKPSQEVLNAINLMISKSKLIGTRLG